MNSIISSTFLKQGFVIVGDIELSLNLKCESERVVHRILTKHKSWQYNIIILCNFSYTRVHWLIETVESSKGKYCT